MARLCLLAAQQLPCRACSTKLLLHCPDTSELGVLALACLQSRMNLLPQELESQISQHSISLDCMEVRWAALLLQP